MYTYKKFIVTGCCCVICAGAAAHGFEQQVHYVKEGEVIEPKYHIDQESPPEQVREIDTIVASSAPIAYDPMLTYEGDPPVPVVRVRYLDDYLSFKVED